ncbi:hypothetical protein QBC33DRAFT_67762 [Phialemonium atrogriseum]|uniref:Uncharacterized protein n=1 Tax=Phialemonium atrogriseum TaxID=1093897 RepID=A0AAJ0FNQ5_9PEZI|nr:uncharacterized protein QBC33DRAFT_67762 [Phialemonium atrogriseum]KAK1767400.1 hypothetical protein QBC33DRAFT_67762 [Phialemonium atrogriseum]
MDESLNWDKLVTRNRTLKRSPVRRCSTGVIGHGCSYSPLPAEKPHVVFAAGMFVSQGVKHSKSIRGAHIYQVGTMAPYQIRRDYNLRPEADNSKVNKYVIPIALGGHPAFRKHCVERESNRTTTNCYIYMCACMYGETGVLCLKRFSGALEKHDPRRLGCDWSTRRAAIASRSPNRHKGGSSTLLHSHLMTNATPKVCRTQRVLDPSRAAIAQELGQRGLQPPTFCDMFTAHCSAPDSTRAH